MITLRDWRFVGAWVWLVVGGAAAVGQSTAPATRPAADNPLYVAWAKAKPGTTVTMTTEPPAEGPHAGKASQAIWHLLQVSDDAVFLEVLQVGHEERLSFTIPRICPPSGVYLSMHWADEKENRMSGFVPKLNTESPEKMTVDGKPLEVTVYTCTGEQYLDLGDQTIVVPTTYSIAIAPSVPGGVVRTEATSVMGEKVNKHVSTATAWGVMEVAPAASRP